MADVKLTPDQMLAEAIGKFRYDPLGYVLFCFPWDTDKDLQVVPLPAKYKKRFPNAVWGPDLWACEFLDRWGEEMKRRAFDGKTAVAPIQFSTASGHGIGKTALTAWIIKFIMDTRPGSRGTVTANTADQLKSKTWAELGKWHHRSLTSHWFEYSSARGAMSLRANERVWRKGRAQEWYCNAQTCREENYEAFAGQHSPTATSFYLFDEASGVPDKIYETREGGTTDGESMTFDFGNPTRNSGKFYDNTVGKLRANYIVQQIDSRSVAITNKDRIADWVRDYGEDSDFVKVRVRGVFPSQGSAQFIPTDIVEAAMARPLVVDRYAQLLIGVDVARFGDNESVLYPRLGMDARSLEVKRYRGLDTVQLTGKVIEMVRGFRDQGLECAGLFVDGGGIGGGVVDQLRSLGYGPIEVQFGGKATDNLTYRYKSDEMWGTMKTALTSRLILPGLNTPNGSSLKDQLTQREFAYTLQGNKIHLETKKDMQERGIESPDLADALALTFAQEVAPATVPLGSKAHPLMTIHEYDPLEYAHQCMQ